MSLGVKTLWRARPRLLGPGHLVPRESPTTIFVSLPLRFQPLSLSHALSSPPGESAAPPSLARDSKEVAEKPVAPPPELLVERLASLPVRRHGPVQSVLVPPRTEYPNARETRRSHNKHAKAVTRQLRLTYLQEAKGMQPADWRVILQNLTMWTAQVDPVTMSETVKVVFSTGAVGMLYEDTENNVWEIRSRTGCEMKLFHGADGKEPFLLLSGQTTAVTAAVEDILRVSRTVKVIHLSRSESADAGDEAYQDRNGQRVEESLTTIRPTRAENARSRYDHDLSVRAIPKPPYWNKRTFEEYVAALTNGHLRPNRASRLYQEHLSHHEATVWRLHELFNDANMHPFISNSSLKMALRYMATTGTRFGHDARALFVRMEMLGVRMDDEVFDILAESAVEAKDLHGFQSAIRLMVNRGHKPTLRTWELFLRIMEAEEVKRYILQAMSQKGLLHIPGAIARVAHQLVAHDIYRCIQQGTSLQEFVKELDGLYGPEWLRTTSANRVLDVLSSYGKSDEMLQFLEIMFASKLAVPDTYTLTIALTHAKLQGNPRMAGHVLSLFEQHDKAHFAQNKAVLHLLFELAFSNDMPHLLDLVFRYASMVDLTGYRMRLRATRILQAGPTWQTGRSFRHLWLRDSVKWKSLALEEGPDANPESSKVPDDERNQVSNPGPHQELGPAADAKLDVNIRGTGKTALAFAEQRGILFSGDLMNDLGIYKAGQMIRRRRGAVTHLLDWYRQTFKDFDPPVFLNRLWQEADARDRELHRAIKEGTEPRFVPVFIRMVRRPRATVDVTEHQDAKPSVASKSLADIRVGMTPKIQADEVEDEISEWDKFLQTSMKAGRASRGRSKALVSRDNVPEAKVRADKAAWEKALTVDSRTEKKKPRRVPRNQNAKALPAPKDATSPRGDKAVEEPAVADKIRVAMAEDEDAVWHKLVEASTREKKPRRGKKMSGVASSF